MACVISFLAGAIVAAMGWVALLAAFRDAAPLPSTRPGWVAVPAKPTRKMLEAAAKAMSPGARPTRKWVSNRKKHEIRYRAMIDAVEN